MKINKKYSNFFYNIIILVFILFIFLIYFSGHTYGALGNDSPGYLYLTNRISNSLPISYEEPLVPFIYNITENISDADIVPPHFTYKIIDYNKGLITPKTQIGFPLILSIFHIFFGINSIYVVNSVLFALSLLLFFLICRNLGIVNRMGNSLLLLFLIGFNLTLFTFTISEPMTEISSIFILTLIFFLLLKTLKIGSTHLLYLSSFLMGLSIQIKITNLIFIPLFLYILISKKEFRGMKNILIVLVFFIIGFLTIFFISPEFKNLWIEDSTNLEKIVSYGDEKHLAGFSLNNFFNNEGKYRAGYGSFFWYIFAIRKILLFQPSLILLGLGSFFIIYKKEYKFLIGILLSIIPLVIFFSFWVNPYDRYIYPAIFPLTLLIYFGLIFLFEVIKSFDKRLRIIGSFLLILLFLSFNINSIIDFGNVISSEEKPSRNYITSEQIDLIDKTFSILDNRSIIVFSETIFVEATFFEVNNKIKTLKVFSVNDHKIITGLLKKYNVIYLFIAEPDIDKYSGDNLQFCRYKQILELNYKIYIYECKYQ